MQTGYRNNNWLNIRYNSNNGWLGQTGADSDGFAQFSNSLYGLRAADRILNNYGALHNINTIDGVINRFAPAADGNPVDNYVNFVSRRTGFLPNDPIDLRDPSIREKLIGAMIAFETPDAANEYSSNLVTQARLLERDSDRSVTTDPDTAINLFTRSNTPPSDTQSNRRDMAVGSLARTSTPADPSLIGSLARISPEAPEIGRTEDPVTYFTSQWDAGLSNMAANTNYFRALYHSIAGDDVARDNALLDATRREQDAASAMYGLKDAGLGDFLEQPTFTGFLNMATGYVGLMGPSAITSMASAIAGSIVGSFIAPGPGTVAGGAAGLGGRTILTALVKKIGQEEAERVLKKKIAFEQAKREGLQNLPPDLNTLEQQFLNSAYQSVRNQYRKYGGITGALAQEYPQGAGISFGTFAEQGMTDPVAAFQSLGLGAPYAALGVAGEAALASSFLRQLQKGRGPVHNTILNAIGGGYARGAFTEGLTETAQEGITIGQRLAIDEEYTLGQARLDAMEAFFAGAMGGGAFGGVGGGVTNVMSRARKSYDDAYLNELKTQFNNERLGRIEAGNNYAEPLDWIDGQITAMLDSSNNKDSVWIDRDSLSIFNEWVLSPNNSNKFENGVFIIDSGMGYLLTTNEQKAKVFDAAMQENPYNSQVLNSSLVDILGYSENKDPSHDMVIEVHDANGIPVWYQSTNMQGLDAAVTKARALFPANSGYTIQQAKDLQQHIDERLAKLPQQLDSEVREFDPNDFTADDQPTINNAEASGTLESTLGTDLEQAQLYANLPVSNDPPILSRSNKGWARGVGRDAELKEKARSYFPYQASNVATTMESDLDQGFYSDSLLNTYVNLSEQNPSNLYIIEEVPTNTDQVTYQIRRLEAPDSVADIGRDLPSLIQQALKKERDAIFKAGEDAATGWKLKTPESSTARPIKMSILMKAAKGYNTRLGLTTPEMSEADKSAQALSTLYMLLKDQGYSLSIDPTVKDPIVEYGTPLSRLDPKYRNVFTQERLSEIEKELAPLELALEINDEIDANPSAEVVTVRGVDYPVDKYARRFFSEEEFKNIRDLRNEKRALEKELGVYEPEVQDIPSTTDPKSRVESAEAQVEKLYKDREDLNLEYRSATDYELGTGNVRQYSEVKKQPSFKFDVSETLSNRFDDSSFVPALVQLARNKFKLKDSIGVYSVDESINTGYAPLDKLLAEQQADMLENNKPARVIHLKQGHIVLINLPENATKLQKGLATLGLAHELGHIVYRQESLNSLDNKGLSKKLFDEFYKARDSGVEQYQGKYGFEEWYADQIGAFLLNPNKRATNQVDSFFKRLADKIREAFNAVSDLVRKRFDLNPVFAEYAQAVTESYINQINDPVAAGIPIEQRALIRDFVDDIVPAIVAKTSNKAALQNIKKTVVEMLSSANKIPRLLRYMFTTSDNFLRSLGPIGEELAAIFYARSQSTDKTGLLTANVVRVNARVNQLSRILGIDDEATLTPEAEKILLDAEDDTKTNAQLSPQARQVREWLSNFYDQENLSSIGVKKLEKYFPRVLDTAEISGNEQLRANLESLILKYNEGMTEIEAKEIVDGFVRDPDENSPDIIDGEAKFKLGMTAKRAKAFRNIPTKELRDLGALQPPAIAIRKYLGNTIKRVELEKRGGPKKIQELINRLPKEQQEFATNAILSLLGKSGYNMHGMFRFINSVGLTYNIVTTLLFATLASVPDIAGPILRSKDFSALKSFGRELARYIQNPQEAARLAKDIGVISTDAINTMYINAGELDFMTPQAKRISEQFFRAIGLEWFTKFTRIMAAGMGRSFIQENAIKAKNGDIRGIRALKELNLTWQQVEAWQKSGQNLEANPEVSLGLARFVDESIVRPNAAERPVLASDPRFALIWQLKSFYYSYGKNIIGGLFRESKNRYNEAGLTAASVPILLGAVTLLPLTMLGLDIRERFKVGLDWLLPFTGSNADSGFFESSGKNYRRSLDMDWGEYMFEVADRAGIFGAPALLFPLFMAEKRYGNPFWVSPLGPSVERSWDLANGDLNIKDVIPIYSQL